MLDTTRWMLGLGYPTRVSSEGGIFVQTEADATIPDTQTVVFDYPDFDCVWQHRSWGKSAEPDFPWGLTIYGDMGTLQLDTRKYEFTPAKGEPVRVGVTYEREQYPEDVDEDGNELHVAPANRAHLRDLLSAIAEGRRPIADIEEGAISTISCILGNLALEVGVPLSYDPESRSIGAAHDHLLARDYRAPYVHP